MWDMKSSRFFEVQILGKGPGCDDAPMYYEHPDIQTWGLNTHILSRPLDMVFEPHDVEWWLKNWDKKELFHKIERGYPKHIERVNELQVPYLTLKHYDFIPTSKAYPAETISQFFGIDYFTGGIDYMMAYALWQGVDKIDLYGVHTVKDDEYEYQKPSLEFWIGVAVGSGTEIRVHGSDTLMQPIYQGRIYTNEGGDADGLRYGYFCKPVVNTISV